MRVRTTLRRLRRHLAYALAVQAALHADEHGVYVPLPPLEYLAEGDRKLGTGN